MLLPFFGLHRLTNDGCYYMSISCIVELIAVSR